VRKITAVIGGSAATAAARTTVDWAVIATRRRSGTPRATKIPSPFQYPRGKLSRVAADGRNDARSRSAKRPGNKRLASDDRDDCERQAVAPSAFEAGAHHEDDEREDAQVQQ
jgi:hypothetical protein